MRAEMCSEEAVLECAAIWSDTFWPLVTVQTTYPKYDVGVRELHCNDALLSAPIMFLGIWTELSRHWGCGRLFRCLAYRIVATRTYE
jgi:hypothetical protein